MVKQIGGVPFIADLFFAVSDIPEVQTAKFPAVTCYVIRIPG